MTEEEKLNNSEKENSIPSDKEDNDHNNMNNKDIKESEGDI